jgi:purine-cytosine permease-like protein
MTEMLEAPATLEATRGSVDGSTVVLVRNDVPIREGVYGERIAAVEPGGVEYIAESERHGRPLNLFWMWASPNLEFATVYVGVLPVVLFGGGFWPTAIALLLGTALGSVFQGLLSVMGPRLGVAQMVESRAGFGFFGNLLPAGLQVLTAGAGWVAVNSVSGAFALQTFCAAVRLPVPGLVLALGIVVLVEILVAFAGYNFIHAIERWVFPFLAVVFLACTTIIFLHARPGTGFDAAAAAAGGGPMGAFMIALFFAFAYAASWNPYASDYSRYLARGASRARVALSAGLGLLVTCGVLEIAGAALATVAGTQWGLSDNPTFQFVKPLPEVLVVIAPLAICVGAISANAINLYSSAMSFLSMGIRISARLRRAIAAVGFGVIGFLVGFTVVRTGQVGPGGTGGSYQNFLFFSTYWIVAFLGVVLADWAMRRGRLDTALVFNRRHRNRAGVIAFVLGIAACVPFMNQSLYIGWIASTYPQTGDLSFAVGFIVSAAAYWLLSRGRAAGDDQRLPSRSGNHRTDGSSA